MRFPVQARFALVACLAALPLGQALAGNPTADLAITKTTTANQVGGGDTIPYTITVSNLGPLSAPSVTVTDALPSFTTFVSVNAPVGWNCTTPAVDGTGTVSCNTGSLSVNSPAVFTLILKVDAATPPSTTIDNTATVSGAVIDTNSANNSAGATTTAPVSLQSYEVD